MALLAAFIGINRFADPNIRELTGCARDARALWALFADTVLDIHATLLLDHEATIASIRKALDATLGAATPDDTVVLSFSGHGTANHQLVTHDSVPQRLADTTIDMGELASRFKASKAKAALCILDCCFSGGAPARVLEDAPAPRSPGVPLEAMTGAGRLLLAASNVNEPALEHGRHGLLTRALIEALQSDADTVSLPVVMDAVMQRVRADAARLGHVQTPVLFGYVEGGLALPALRRGPRYFQAFPEAKGLRVSARIDDLSGFGLPAPLIAAWHAQFPSGLNALQLAAVNEHRVLDGQSLLVVAPTSSGKTFIGEMAAARALVEQRKAVFLFPYKALVNEKFDQFTQLYGDALGARVIRCTGDYLDRTTDFVRGRYDLAILTYEMFLNLSLARPATLDPLGLIVVDEAQFISDRRRGIAVELLLTNLLAARDRDICPQLVALSAVIGDLNGFDDWLGSGKLVSQERPVPLIEGVLDRNGTFRFVDEMGEEQLTELLPRHAVVQRKENPGAQDVIVPLVRQLLARNETERIIVFRNRRGPAEGCAKYLAADLGLPPATSVLAALPYTDLSTSSQSLRSALQGGTAFHNADLNREERLTIEKAFRQGDGGVKVLAATTTVAAGINTPASTVILAEQEFIGEENQPFTIAEYKNMAGRAGRLGYRETGRSIVLASTPLERDALFRRYVLGKPEPIRSSFDPRHMETWVLRLLSQVKKVRRDDVVHLLASTYGGYLASKTNPNWQQGTTAKLAALLEQMTELGLLEEELGFVRLTLLGQACGRSSLSFLSAMRLIRMLREAHGRAVTAVSLMGFLQALPELDDTYTPVMKRGHAESRWPQEVQRLFGAHVAHALQQQAEDHWGYYGRCKRAAVLHAWISGTAMDAIEHDATTNAYQGKIGSGDVRKFADVTRFHLRPAHDIATVLLLANVPANPEIDGLLRQLEVGIPADTLRLLDLPVPLTRGEYLALRGRGVRNPDDFWKLSDDDMAVILGLSRSKELARLRPSHPP